MRPIINNSDNCQEGTKEGQLPSKYLANIPKGSSPDEKNVVLNAENIMEDTHAAQFINLIKIVNSHELKRGALFGAKQQASKAAIDIFRACMHLGSELANKFIRELIIQAKGNSEEFSIFEQSLINSLELLNIDAGLTYAQKAYFSSLQSSSADKELANISLEESIIANILKQDKFQVLPEQLSESYAKLIRTSPEGKDYNSIIQDISNDLHDFYSLDMTSKENAEHIVWRRVIQEVCKLFALEEFYRQQFISYINAEDNAVLESWMTDDKFLDENSDVRQRIWQQFLHKICADPKRDKELTYITEVLIAEARELAAIRDARLSSANLVTVKINPVASHEEKVITLPL